MPPPPRSPAQLRPPAVGGVREAPPPAPPPQVLTVSLVASVWKGPHNLHNNDGFCLPFPVFLLSASSAKLFLRCQLSSVRGASDRNGQNDKIKNVPGVPAKLSPNLQLHPLQSPPGQSRRAHFQVFSGKPGTSLPL